MSVTMKLSRWSLRGIGTGVLLVQGILGVPTVVANDPSIAGDSTVSFSKIEQVVVDHFRAIPDYQPGTIITRSQVEPVLRKLDRLGWPVADRNEILDRVLADDDWLVQELRTSDGRKFASHIAGQAQGYDRLDRLTRLANGRRIVRDLIHGPGGYRMIEYMTQSRGGRALGRMLSKAPNGADFNQPTGRIYTLDALLAQLNNSHQTTRRSTP
jgi:hypothetical protein